MNTNKTKPIEMSYETAVGFILNKTGLSRNDFELGRRNNLIRLPFEKDHNGDRWVMTEDVEMVINKINQSKSK